MADAMTDGTTEPAVTQGSNRTGWQMSVASMPMKCMHHTLPPSTMAETQRAVALSRGPNFSGCLAIPTICMDAMPPSVAMTTDRPTSHAL
ncbi:hypothetical protein [Caldimonas sp.]|uniref:hypothetical protein n=1 Tax=Caldimonas sp. TaxID=2838790 RepID=UPI00391B3962